MYDDVVSKSNKSSKVSTRSSSSTTDSLEDMRIELEESNKQLEDTKSISKVLKDKLRECSKQLQEYETERSSIVDVLNRQGIDTKGVLGTDSSTSDEASILEQDLSDCVNKLAQKFNALQTQLKQATSRSTKTTESQNDHTAELEELKAQRVALECESLKSQITSLNSDIDTLRNKLDGKDSSASSEISILEEENIELMKENKELRKEAASLRVLADRSNKIENHTPSTDYKNVSLSGIENDSSTRGVKRVTSDVKTAFVKDEGMVGDKKKQRVSKATALVTVPVESAEEPGDCKQS
jgi:septal ring factor EnvC (AmiA/AmiB activator)